MEDPGPQMYKAIKAFEFFGGFCFGHLNGLGPAAGLPNRTKNPEEALTLQRRPLELARHSQSFLLGPPRKPLRSPRRRWGHFGICLGTHGSECYCFNCDYHCYCLLPRRGQEEPGEARSGQEGPGGARRSEEEPGEAPV